MTIYIDADCKCHTECADGLTAIETDFFDGKCVTYIEGYRFIPAGQTWTREDGEEFEGEMVTPWRPYDELDQVQRAYEQELATAALILLGEATV